MSEVRPGALPLDPAKDKSLEPITRGILRDGGLEALPPAGSRGRAPGLFSFIELLVNLGLPWLVYTLLSPHYGDFIGLAASAAPPALWSLFELAMFRKLDALSLLILGGISLSLLAVAFGGSPRMLMVRDNLFTVPIGLAFLGTAWLKRPLFYYAVAAFLARQPGDGRANFESAWQRPHITRGLRVISIVWGVGLILQGVLLGWMAWTWPIGPYLLVSPVLGYGAMALMGVWTWWYQGQLRVVSERLYPRA